jgi:hypothetical protein
MITDCWSGDFYVSHYPLDVFFEDLTAFASIVVPAALIFALVRIFLAPRGRVITLGLTETSAPQSESSRRKLSYSMLLLYVLASFLTFTLGLRVFDGYCYLTELLANVFIRWA